VPESVEHPPEQAGPHVDAERATERLHTRSGVEAVEFAERHQQHAALVEPHHFREHGALARVAGDAAQRAKSHVDAGGFHHQPDNARHAAVLAEAIGAGDAIEHDVDRRRVGGVGLGAEGRGDVGRNHDRRPQAWIWAMVR